ncbi:MAG: restriction endonuclease subunit S [Proteobacteria bacterium]|nr:restriction endonuclease subunit S [Pseudomonadota bacterium]
MEGWKEAPLGEVCQLINRGISPAYTKVGGVAVLNQKCVRDHSINLQLARRHDSTLKKVNPDRFVRVGDVLVNSTGTGTLGRVAQLREAPLEPTTVDSHVTIVRPVDGLFYPEFFGYALVAIEEQIQNGGEGCGGQTELSRSKLASGYSVRFPTDHNEQRRIVAILDEAFDAIATAKANTEKNLFSASEVFNQQHDAIFAVHAGHPDRYRLGDLAAFRNGVNFTKRSKGRGVQIIGVKDFQNHFWAPLDDLDTVTLDGDLSPIDAVSEGDILTVRSNGNPELIGRSMVVGSLTEPTTHSGFTIRISLDRTKAVPAYVCQFLRSRAVRRKLIDGGNGLNIKSLNQGMLAEIAVPLPPPSTQQEIVAKIEMLAKVTNDLAAIAARKLTALEELKKSLLHQAFTGQLSAKAADRQLAAVD